MKDQFTHIPFTVPLTGYIVLKNLKASDFLESRLRRGFPEKRLSADLGFSYSGGFSAVCS
jgi:hypothetical protein